MNKKYNRRRFLQMMGMSSVSIATVLSINNSSFANMIFMGGGLQRSNNIGTPAEVGFGIGVAPYTPTGFTMLTGTTSITHDNYGNYQYTDGSIMCWIPAFYYRIGHADNPTYGTYGVNSVDIKAESYFLDETAANVAGYALHRAFKDGGATKRGFMVDKYMCSKNALGTGYAASSIANGLPISTSSAHNPIADLTACSSNNYYQVVNAAHARDGVDGAENASSVFFCCSRFVIGTLAMLSMAHGQSASSTTNCAWYDATNNFPKGCNNNALGDTNDGAVKWESDGYSNCGKTGSAGYGGGVGNEFAKSTHNGQACGIADLNGLMWEINIGMTCISSDAAIEGMTQASPCAVTWTGHGRTTGDVVRINGIAQADWVGLKDKMFQITVVDSNTVALDGVDTSAFAVAYDAATDPGTITKGDFYIAKESTAMADFTSGNSSATDHWGGTGAAAMMESISPAFETGYASNGYSQRFGSGANQVLSEDVSGNSYKLTGLGFPYQADGIDTTGTNLFGKDYYYQYLRNELCLLSGAPWTNTSNAGVWAVYWNNYRTNSHYYVGFRLACYPV